MSLRDRPGLQAACLHNQMLAVFNASKPQQNPERCQTHSTRPLVCVLCVCVCVRSGLVLLQDPDFAFDWWFKHSINILSFKSKQKGP